MLDKKKKKLFFFIKIFKCVCFLFYYVKSGIIYCRYDGEIGVRKEVFLGNIYVY